MRQVAPLLKKEVIVDDEDDGTKGFFPVADAEDNEAFQAGSPATGSGNETLSASSMINWTKNSAFLDRFSNARCNSDS